MSQTPGDQDPTTATRGDLTLTLSFSYVKPLPGGRLLTVLFVGSQVMKDDAANAVFEAT
ncbi:hypothetical protein MYCODSM44623_05534 (plasmid) [Mycobacterium intracellulare subsp. chimaera]|nr:hypothetical protein MYCODSM44623_05534 [Mycobacterium intracellulare subsp. chimaera]